MRWFDSDFDYVQELIDTWNSRRKKMRAAYIIIAAVLLIAGVLTAVFPVGQVVKGLEKLGVNHPHQVIEGRIGVRDAAEQGHLFLAHFLQMQVVGAGEAGDLRQVEGGQPDTDADQNGF